MEEGEQPVHLSLISAAIHYGCMSLPQELVCHVTDMLRHDLLALKACSLTCKAMFASTRHLIHQTSFLTLRNNQRVLTQKQISHYQRGDFNDATLRIVTYMGKSGVFRYARQVHINMHDGFTPNCLRPHFHHFRSLDQVHTLAIDYFYTIKWAGHHQTYFVHFYPTLTSLTLWRPFGHYEILLQFVLQFPNLENLCLQRLEGSRMPRVAIPTTVEHSPPLRGHLQLVGLDTGVQWSTNFARELPNGMNFRSIELEDLDGNRVQRTLGACAHTLENLTIVPRGTGMYRTLFSSFFP